MRMHDSQPPARSPVQDKFEEKCLPIALQHAVIFRLSPPRDESLFFGYPSLKSLLLFASDYRFPASVLTIQYP